MKMKNISSLILTAVVVLLFVAVEIQASCPLVVQHPPCAEFWRADAVFIATATEVQTKPQGFSGAAAITARLSIEESFKGIAEKEIMLEPDGCDYQFTQGEKYLVYAHRRPENKKLIVKIGRTRTKPLAEAAEDLNYIRSLLRGEPQAQIVGRIGQHTAEIKESGRRFDSNTHFFGAPLAGIKVFAKGAEQTYETFSDAKGEYAFFGLPAGEYEIRADYPIYFESRKETVQTTAQGCGIGNIAAWRKGAISGRVTDAKGAAVVSLRLSLVSADAAPEEILEERENQSVWHLGNTDEKGEFHFTRLPAGRYFIVINRSEFERSRMAERLQKIPRLFYPGVKNLEKATVISIEEGEQVKGKDFRLPKFE